MFYRVDKQNVILEVGPDWDGFAHANGGAAGLTSDAVLGRCLLDFVAGDSARMFVHAALQAARVLGDVRRLPYRCDSPTHRRHFDMVLRVEPDDVVCVEHLLASEELKPLRPAQRQARGGWRCSQCLAWRRARSTGWIDVDAAPAGVLADALCPACAMRLPAV